MLHEGNAIVPGGSNALVEVLRIEPIPLDAGLQKLADLQPEQLPAEGIGTLKRKRCWADITGSTNDADSLFQLFRTHFNEALPVFVEAAPEPSTSDIIEDGESITLALPMRGHVQVRVAELGNRDTTLLTLEGHPLAGAVHFSTAPVAAGVRFQVEVFDRAANVLDLIAMRTLGDRLQGQTWTEVVENVVRLSGGRAPDGVQDESRSLDDEEAKRVEKWVDDLALRRKRTENAERIAGTA
jgi:NADH dehydrogenase